MVDFVDDFGLVYFDYGWQVMVYGVYGVMCFVVVQGLVVFFSGIEFDGLYLVYCNVGGDFGLVCGWWYLVVIGVGYVEFVVVQVQWVIGYGEIVYVDVYVVVLLYYQWVDVGEGLVVLGLQVEVQYGVDFGY